jgi:hypothetical protein
LGQFALQAWNGMGGLIDWNAVPVFCELYGIEDVELFIAHLTAIRDRKND